LAVNRRSVLDQFVEWGVRHRGDDSKRHHS
jgi:hypothetical protein